MYRDVNDYLEINEIQSVTILFSILYRNDKGDWKMVEAGDGFALYQQLQSLDAFTLSKANSTQFIHFNEELMDTYYAARIDANRIDDPQKWQAVFSTVQHIRKNFASPQIFINDYYELHENDAGLEKFVRYFHSTS